MSPRRAHKTQSAPQDAKGNHYLKIRHNNAQTSIPKITIATSVQAIQDLKENQNKLIATVKQF